MVLDNNNAKSPPDIIAPIIPRQLRDAISGGRSASISRVYTHLLRAARRPACCRGLAAALAGRLVLAPVLWKGTLKLRQVKVPFFWPLFIRSLWPLSQTCTQLIFPKHSLGNNNNINSSWIKNFNIHYNNS